MTRTPRAPLYDDAAHLQRIRYLLHKRVETLPLKALVKLSEAAILLEEGASLGVLLARERLGKRRGKLQAQRREDLDRGMRDEAARVVTKRISEAEARVALEAYVPAWRQRLTGGRE